MCSLQVAKMSKQRFKDLVKRKSLDVTTRYLQKMQKSHSKSKSFDVNGGVIAQYLVDSRLNKYERELLFKLRSRTLNVKENFKSAFWNSNLLCDLCHLFPCTQAHVIQCPVITTKIILEKDLRLDESFVYSDIDKQVIYVKIFKQFWETRKKVLENGDTSCTR